MRAVAIDKPESAGGGVSALLVGVGMLMLGVGLQQVLLGVRAVSEGFPTVLTGMLMSSYYGGFLAGSLIVPRLISGVGHIRTFAALASLASGTVLVHAVQVDPFTWSAIRFVNGACVAGLFVVSESWLNSKSTNETRGHLLSIYMVIVLGALGGGQLMVNVADPAGFGLFVIVSVLLSVAVVPLALTPQAAPVVAESRRMGLGEVFRAAPLAIMGAALAGVASGSLFTIGAVFARSAGFSIARVSVIMTVTLLGAVVLQLPIGRLSDRVDRRRVIGGCSTVAALAAGLTLRLDLPGQLTPLLLLMAAVGATSMPLYSLCAAYLNDRIDEVDMVGASGKLVMANGLGSVAGPLLATTWMGLAGPGGFLWHLAGVHGLLALYTAYRLTRLAPVEPRSPYAPLPTESTPVLVSVDPTELDDPFQPATTGFVDGDGVTLRYSDWGDGEPVVFIHEAASSGRAWQYQMRSLPAHGYRVITYDLRGHGDSTPGPRYRVRDHAADLEALLSSLAASPAHLVGQGAGASIAVALTRQRPDMVRTLTLVGYASQVLPYRRLPRVGTHAEIAMERGLARVIGRDAMARRLASYQYDAARNPDRHDLIANDAARADQTAIGRTRTAAAASRPLRLDDLHVPVLVAIGGRDPTAPRDAARIAGPASLVVISGAGPFAALDSPHHFNDALFSFLERARDASAVGSSSA